MESLPREMAFKAEIVKGSLNDVISELRARGVENLYVDGGKVIQSFLREDLIDEMIITRVPVLLGDGIPLFGKMDAMKQFTRQKT
ncbi:dihydrofolate reductase family protein [Rubellicoccus peritrichatus]|uniref:Dihydrofolate reductase family protein n=1 Tax=Rubellicoccus peritrichatus TaxID=3080537 RepID=A0AAQ3LFA7_9BACT|nr:dihydrofolate reductase family protein [Puniceicoccus sp. CR14]WOO43479.1 dihydrofolate reductase family protein [Puniceicoccus sp. CR14]